MKRSDIFSPHAMRRAGTLACLALVAAVAELTLGGHSSITTRSLRGFGVWLSLAVLHVGASAVMSQYQSRDRKSHITVYTLVLTSVVSVAFVQLLATALVAYGGWNAPPGEITKASIAFTVPYTVGVLVSQSIRGLQLGLLASIAAALLYGWYQPLSAVTTAMVLTSSIVACLVFRRGVRSRATYLQAAACISLSMLPFAILSLWLHPRTLTSLSKEKYRRPTCATPLLLLAEREVAPRDTWRIQMGMKLVRFPFVRTLEGLAFDALPSIHPVNRSIPGRRAWLSHLGAKRSIVAARISSVWQGR